jgi:molecular chaperone GrpE
MWHRPSERERTPPTLVGHAACDAMQPHDCPHARLVRVELDERRRQLERRQALQSQQEMAELVADLLEVLDTAEAAVRHQMTGAELLRTQLDRVLGRHGVERVDLAGDGQPFDPRVHQAVRHEPGECSPTVVDLLRAGYRWKGRLLRPALVAVKG